MAPWQKPGPSRGGSYARAFRPTALVGRPRDTHSCVHIQDTHTRVYVHSCDARTHNAHTHRHILKHFSRVEKEFHTQSHLFCIGISLALKWIVDCVKSKLKYIAHCIYLKYIAHILRIAQNCAFIVHHCCGAMCLLHLGGYAFCDMSRGEYFLCWQPVLVLQIFKMANMHNVHQS